MAITMLNLLFTLGHIHMALVLYLTFHPPICLPGNSFCILPRIAKCSKIVCYEKSLEEFGFQQFWPTFVTLTANFVQYVWIQDNFFFLGSPNFHLLCIIKKSQTNSESRLLGPLLCPWWPLLNISRAYNITYFIFCTGLPNFLWCVMIKSRMSYDFSNLDLFLQPWCHFCPCIQN